jgi:DnaJ-class molecular chaperone
MSAPLENGQSGSEREWLEGLRYEDKFACEACGGTGLRADELDLSDESTARQELDDARCHTCNGTGVS